MEMTFFTSVGWESWDVEARPVIPDRIPVLVDDDLLFDDGGGPRPCVPVNRWLRELLTTARSTFARRPVFRGLRR
jgi:hypothetical protein